MKKGLECHAEELGLTSEDSEESWKRPEQESDRSTLSRRENCHSENEEDVEDAHPPGDQWRNDLEFSCPIW
jgi:hypothetical protein